MRPAAKILALTALALWGPWILLPAIHVEQLGRSCDTSILDGCTLLLGEGELFLGAVVGLSALVLPPLKLTLLLWLEAAPRGHLPPRHRLRRAVEVIGRFGLLEVFLTGVLVALVRLGALVSFRPLPGLYVFAVSALLALGALAALGLTVNLTEKPHERRTV
jgi:paraquat-inducible protein A